MMCRELKQQLRRFGRTHVGATPSRAWKDATRDVLLQQIRNTVDSPSRAGFSLATKDVLEKVTQAMRIFFPQNMLAVSRSIGMVTVALAVTVGGWIASVSASVNTLPGDALYHVKLATEKTELIVASVVGTKQDRVETLLRHASNRVEEYQKSKTPDQAVQVMESLKKSIESANKTLENVNGSDASVKTEVARVVDEKTQEMLDSLESVSSTDASATLAAGDTPEALEAVKQVTEATNLLEVAGVKAVEFLAEQTLAGNTEVDIEQVKARVEKKLEKIATDVSALNKNVAAVSTIVASSTEAALIGMLAISSSTAAVATTTIGVPGGVEIATSSEERTTQEAVRVTEQKVGEANRIVEQGVAEAKTLIGNNDLLGAIKKIQSLTEVKQDAGSAVAVLEANIIASPSQLPK